MDMFHALAEPTRRSILEMLGSKGQLSATEIGAQFPVSPPAISQHLKVLREANLVLMEKRAQHRLYRINPDALLELQDWTRQITEMWNRHRDEITSSSDEAHPRKHVGAPQDLDCFHA
jgi:DNA-binding transcriptional ArsR family regulator